MIYDVADLRIGMENRFGWTDRFCEKWLSEDQSSPADFTVGVTPEALGRERQAAEERGERYSDGYIENICLYREICLRLPRYDRFLLHGAVVGCDGVINEESNEVVSVSGARNGAAPTAASKAAPTGARNVAAPTGASTGSVVVDAQSALILRR